MPRHNFHNDHRERRDHRGESPEWTRLAALIDADPYAPDARPVLCGSRPASSMRNALSSLNVPASSSPERRKV